MAFGNVEDRAEKDSSGPYLEAIKSYHKEFDRWFSRCDQVDRIYSGLQSLSGIRLDFINTADREYDLFWASMEVIKPSIYSRPPVPVVTCKFKDRDPVKGKVAELLERAAISGFDLTDINSAMLGARDDLAINARGQLWVSYEDDGREKVCIEHLDRDDFAHDPVRKWSEVTWVARRAWLTRKQMNERFGEEIAARATYTVKRTSKDGDTSSGVKDTTNKCAVWELWDKDEKKVVWVSEGISEVLDKDDPHLKLECFFPCPEPAYGTTQRRTLVPVPSLVYIQGQLETINLLTQRIHDLAEHLRVVGVIPGASDLGDAIETALRTPNASSIFVPVAASSMMQGGSLVEWLPIDQVAQTILAAVEERRELIGNVQELLGVADIMRGDTEAQETLGAQQLKAQYGSVRVRDMIKGLERIARDAGRIMVEIFAEEFSIETLLKMAQMELPTEAEVKRQIKEIEKAAKAQLDAIEQGVAEAMQQAQAEGAEGPDQEAIAAAQQQSQQVLEEASKQVAKAAREVTLEAVKELLKDTKTDPFIFDIETDSTIFPDELAEKQARNEFMATFVQASQALAPLVASGPTGAKMAGELLKFQLGPYRAGRQLEGVIDEWVDSLGDEQGEGNGDDTAKQLAESQMALAEAEMQKARAQTMKVEADAAAKQAEMQARMSQMQGEFQEKAAKIQLENQKLQLQGTKQQQEFAAKMAEMDAKQNLMQAQTAEILSKIGLDVRKQDLEEYRVATDTAFRAEDQARAAEGQAFDQARAVSQEGRAERQQDFSERSGERSQALEEQQAREKPE